MNKISDLRTLSYYENRDFGTRHGIYQAKFMGNDRLFVITNNIAYVLTHYSDKSMLDVVRQEVRDELFELLGLKPLDRIKEAQNEVI